MDLGLTKTIILELQDNPGITKDEVYRGFGETPEARIAISWRWPDRYLDGDLIKNIGPLKQELGNLGHDVNLEEVLILLEAFRNQQYQGFLRHLIHSFCSEGSSVFPIRQKGQGDSCCICGRPLLYWHEWVKTCKTLPDWMKERETRNHLALGSNTTGVCLCTDCLVQLKAFQCILDGLDPGILNYQKSTPGGLKA